VSSPWAQTATATATSLAGTATRPAPGPHPAPPAQRRRLLRSSCCVRHRPAAHQLHAPRAVDPPCPAPRLAPPSAPHCGLASPSRPCPVEGRASPRAHHYGARVYVVSLEDAYLRLSSHGTQNGLCVWVICWSLFLGPKSL
jgi:hypothetical protein